MVYAQAFKGLPYPDCGAHVSTVVYQYQEDSGLQRGPKGPQYPSI